MSAIRKAARGQECTVELAGVCQGGTETTVLAHSNRGQDGKGLALKADDTAAAFACFSCHDVLDGRKPRPFWLTRADVARAFAAGVRRTHENLKARGLL